MSRNPEYQFVEIDDEKLEAAITAVYERITGVTVRPASPEKLFIKWATSIILQEQVQANYIANQNIPSRAEGENLDALGELFFVTQRPEASPATCMERFYISEPQETAILIPAGTRVTDSDRMLIWETEEDAYIEIGASCADVRIHCQTAGAIGNDYALGQINTIVDVFDYYAACENITVSDSGSDVPNDDEYYALMRASMDGYSTAGGMGNYIYHAKLVSTLIADVVANSPSPGEVRLYILMSDGEIASDEVKAAVYEECNADYVRPLTDHVLIEDPETVPYDIDLTYWVNSESTTSAAEVQSKVAEAIEKYRTWQSAKLGRDINPSKLYSFLMETGIKRVELRSPAFTPLRDGKLALSQVYEYEETKPQLAVCNSVAIISGGYEDE